MCFNKNGDLVKYTRYEPEGMGWSCAHIPANQCRIIKKNLLEGKPFWLASPVYEISREEAAAILINDAL